MLSPALADSSVSAERFESFGGGQQNRWTFFRQASGLKCVWFVAQCANINIYQFFGQYLHSTEPRPYPYLARKNCKHQPLPPNQPDRCWIMGNVALATKKTHPPAARVGGPSPFTSVHRWHVVRWGIAMGRHARCGVGATTGPVAVGITHGLTTDFYIFSRNI